MTIQGKRVLAIVAHPDDETRFSGTLRKLMQAGNHVTLVVATDGDKGTHDKQVSPIAIAETRRIEMQNAADILGIQLEWLGFSDGTLQLSQHLKERVFRCVRVHRPDVLITFDPFKKYDFHTDHITIGQVASEAAYLADGCWYYPEHLIEGIEPHKPAEVYLFNAEVPNYSVDIRAQFDAKARAAEAHRSQFGSRTFEEFERELLRIYGGSPDDLYTERFRKVYFTDICL